MLTGKSVNNRILSRISGPDLFIIEIINYDNQYPAYRPCQQNDEIMSENAENRLKPQDSESAYRTN